MKTGYYLFAYLEINKYACLYNVETKRHDQNMSLWFIGDNAPKLLRYWELERLSRIKHHNKAFFSDADALDFIDNELASFGITHHDLIAIIGTPGLGQFDVNSVNNTDYYPI